MHAIGLPELIAHSLQEYETLALKLANDSAYLADIKTKLLENQKSYPLFDTELFCRNLEQTLCEIVANPRGPV